MLFIRARVLILRLMDFSWHMHKTAQICAQGALMLAAAIDDAELIELLVAAGAEVNGSSHDSPRRAD